MNVQKPTPNGKRGAPELANQRRALGSYVCCIPNNFGIT